MSQNRLTFFMIILFFAGSVAIMGALELRRHHKENPTDASSADAKRIIEALAGFTLSPDIHQRFIKKEAIPDRSEGGVLLENDRKAIRAMLRNIVPAEESE